MAIPVEPDGPTWKVIALGALGVAQLLFAWIAGWILKSLREMQQIQEVRITKLENTYVTRDELDRHVQRLEESARRMHEINTATMTRIEEKVERASQTRHDIRDSVHATQLMVREFLERQRQQNRER